MENTYCLTFHHLGLAVRIPERAKQFLSGLGYSMGDEVYDRHQEVNLIFCEHRIMPAVEIIFPTLRAGPLDNILAAHTELIYHTCFESSDVHKSVATMKAEGHRVFCISPPSPAPLFDNRNVSFYSVLGFGLIEILESPP